MPRAPAAAVVLAFVALGPPLGFAAALAVWLGLSVAFDGGVPRVVWRHLPGLALQGAAASYLLGGLQALAAGLLAARGLARTGRLPARAVLLGAAALAVASTGVLSQVGPLARQMPTAGLAALLFVAHLAAALGCLAVAGALVRRRGRSRRWT